MHSCLYVGQVRHRRFLPRAHAFRYSIFFTYLDLDELDQVFKKRWFWSTRLPALAWFRRRDYLGDNRTPLKQAVLDKVEAECGFRPEGPVRLLTHIRYFGFTFNPVSFYYCFDSTGQHCKAIVAEITNTPWGERYAYVLPVTNSTHPYHHLRFEMDKVFHVSPFMPMDIDYQWSFTEPGDKLNVHMINLKAEQKQFDATLTLERKPISAFNCALVLTKYPFITFKVVGGIYWQAFKLWLKRIPFHTHPDKLDQTDSGGASSAKTR